ncbi:MAG: bleomycin resistance protein [Pseudomonadales bacterium]|nr:bleomycin resistance protein [Pseudomonadales bacterium]
MRIGDSMLMVSSGEVRGSYAACLYIYVADVEVCFAKAVAAGAEVIEAPLVTPYGDRRAVIRDRWGNMWQIAEYRNR